MWHAGIAALPRKSRQFEQARTFVARVPAYVGTVGAGEWVVCYPLSPLLAKNVEK